MTPSLVIMDFLSLANSIIAVCRGIPRLGEVTVQALRDDYFLSFGDDHSLHVF